MRGRRSLLLATVALLALAGRAAAALAAQNQDKPAAVVRAEIGIDSYERRYYRPEFGFAWPLSVLPGSRAFLELSYLQRTNGRLQGPIDFWLSAGLTHRLTETVTLEAGLTHFCRHTLSTETDYILNYNELVGRVRYRPGPVEIGAGFGRFVGGSPGFRELAVFDLVVPRLLSTPFSIRSAIKWVNFSEIYYEAEFAADLTEGAAAVIRASKAYGLPASTYLGLRLSSEGAPRKLLNQFAVSFGFYPFYDSHKLLAGGGFRFDLIELPGRRFFIDLSFDTPILSGSGFFNQFWPDRMIYSASAEYELPIGRWYAAWYGRYFVDMPADKDLAPSSGLATGAALRNQRDFDRLDRGFRFEAAAGYDFKNDYDARLNLGLNTFAEDKVNAGAEFRWQGTRRRRAAEFKIFAEIGRELSVRPFFGIKKITYVAGGPPGPDPLKRMLTLGVALYRWF